MGTAYLRKNKLRQAEHHFRRAVEINPSNAVLVCCVGQVRHRPSSPDFLCPGLTARLVACLQVLERRGKKEEALELFERAFSISPDSPMVAFRRAKALVALGQIQVRSSPASAPSPSLFFPPTPATDSTVPPPPFPPPTLLCRQPALLALQTLVLKAPNEFNIHFLLGKLYKLTHDPANAMRSFAHALDLDPKMASAIKAAQEPAKEDGEDEDDEEGGHGADESYRTDEGSRL